jgi:hypothetical protein
MISLDIYNNGHLKINNKMGNVSIGKNATTKLGRQHWAKVLEYPQEQRISFWHPIQPPPAARSRGPSPVMF